MCCNGSIEGRNALNDRVSAKWIDCTGGQAAYEDGDLEELGEELVEASRETSVKIFHVFRMFDPGLGLDFPMWWVEGGIKAKIFSQYKLPDDVVASLNDSSESEENSELNCEEDEDGESDGESESGGEIKEDNE